MREFWGKNGKSPWLQSLFGGEKVRNWSPRRQEYISNDSHSYIDPDQGSITPTAREFRGKRGKPSICISQSDGSILTTLTALVCQQSTTNRVGKSGQKEGLFQRLLKMSQSVGGVNSGDFDTGVHPTGTSIFKYRRNQIFCTADCKQKGPGRVHSLERPPAGPFPPQTRLSPTDPTLGISECLSNKSSVFVSFSRSLSLHLEFRCCIDRLRSQPHS